MIRPFAVMAAIVVNLGICGLAHAQTLRIGVATETSSLDPHYSMTNPNVSLNRHIYDPLVRQDERQRVTPGLSVAWRVVSPTEWEYELRPGVRFHNGAALSAEDIVFSLRRAGNLPNAPAGFGVMTRHITSVRIVSPSTIRIQTAEPFPLMNEHLSAVAIVSRATSESAETKDFNTGAAAVGTGPFRLASWGPGQPARLTRNDDWWDRQAEWRSVDILQIPDAAARVAALLSGSVDIIDQIPTSLLATLRQRQDMRISETLSNRVVFLLINHLPTQHTYVRDAEGQPLAVNPLRDLRVRQAISKAINRQTLIERVLEGAAKPAAQILPEGHGGVSKRLHPEAHDIEAARALLAKAGYERGFGLTMQLAPGRNVGDQQIAEAIAQMLSRIGIKLTLEAMPNAMFATRQGRGEFNMMLRSWGTETGEVSMALRSLLGTRDMEKGWGTLNRGGYSNPQLDRQLREALTIFDPAARHEKLARASETAMADLPIIPLHFQAASWAMRQGLSYKARADNYTFAWDVRLVGP